jgi:hypothetical protein
LPRQWIDHADQSTGSRAHHPAVILPHEVVRPAIGDNDEIAGVFVFFAHQALSEQNRLADVSPVHHISEEMLRKPKIYLKSTATLSAAKCYKVNKSSVHPPV